MGSSCDTNGSKILDSKVGGLVWVRRRNGSWWPGRILGSDELPESCLATPRSGTPVKLLGREDASVDWYNFEKSKRVKAFRCGEYDECIEKAKITASVSSKKAVKYARREDAILHALELEASQELSRTATPSNHSPQDSKQPDEETENTSDKLSSLEQHVSVSPQELSRTAASADHSSEELSRTAASGDHSSEGCKHPTPHDSEDDAAEGSKKRMRGLEDITTGGAVSSFKRRRTQVAHVHDYLKKKHKRRQLTTVLKSTMVTVPVMCEQTTGSKASGKECSDVKRSFCDSNGGDVENYDFYGRLFDVPFVGEEKKTAGSSRGLVSQQKRVSAGGQSGQSSLIETLPGPTDEIQESGSISSGAAVTHKIDTNGTSEWQHKGKRKSRNKTKTVQKFANPNTVTEKVEIDESRVINETAGGPQRPIAYLSYHQKSETTGGALYDVDIEVKAGHFPHHVPYISLLSKSTGQPVTGHSLQVEIINDSGSECVTSSRELDPVNGNVPEASRNPRKNNNNGGSCNKKIRRLSSLTGVKRPSEREPSSTIKRPVLACVPLTVVFSRINAALGINTAQSDAR